MIASPLDANQEEKIFHHGDTENTEEKKQYDASAEEK